MPWSLRNWIQRRKGPFQDKERMYALGINFRPLQGAQSLPRSAGDITQRAQQEGRELTTRERLYHLLLDQRESGRREEWSVRERLAPQQAEVAVKDKLVFAVVSVRGFQMKVHPDDILYTQRVEDWKARDHTCDVMGLASTCAMASTLGDAAWPSIGRCGDVAAPTSGGSMQRPIGLDPLLLQVNDVVELTDVMLLGSQLETIVGRQGDLLQATAATGPRCCCCCCFLLLQAADGDRTTSPLGLAGRMCPAPRSCAL